MILIKLWLEVGRKEQKRRFRRRIEDPLRQWKLSPMDLKSYSRWYEYSRARDAMFDGDEPTPAPWYVLPSDDKKRARLNGITHILSQIPYKKKKRDKAELPKRSEKNRYDDASTSTRSRWCARPSTEARCANGRRDAAPASLRSTDAARRWARGSPASAWCENIGRMAS